MKHIETEWKFNKMIKYTWLFNSQKLYIWIVTKTPQKHFFVSYTKILLDNCNHRDDQKQQIMNLGTAMWNVVRKRNSNKVTILKMEDVSWYTWWPMSWDDLAIQQVSLETQQSGPLLTYSHTQHKPQQLKANIQMFFNVWVTKWSTRKVLYLEYLTACTELQNTNFPSQY